MSSEHKNHSNDSLEYTSNKYNQWQIYLNGHDTLKNKYEVNFSQRVDYLPIDNKLKYRSQGNDLNIKTDLIKNKVKLTNDDKLYFI